MIPLGTDQIPKRRIIVTPILIGLNLAVFLGVILLARFDMVALKESYGILRLNHNAEFTPFSFAPWGLISYQFMHDPNGISHIGFNMLFLWVFGQAVESRLGAIGFACFYLVGGAFAGLAHMLLSPAPLIGASGAVAAVSGAFLILFPRATIKILLIFFIIGIYHIPAVWFIGFFIAYNVLNQFSVALGSESTTSFAAHLGGYFFGAAVAAILLATKILPRTDLDMVYLFKQARRRKAMRQAVAQTPAIWDAPSAQSSAPKAKTKTPEPVAPDPHAKSKQEITALLRAHEGEEALRTYMALREQGIKIVLPEEQQVDLANRLLAGGNAEEAAQAYQWLLERRGVRSTGAGVSSDDIRLLMASLYIRRLNRADDARPLLKELSKSSLNPASSDLRTQLLKELEHST